MTTQTDTPDGKAILKEMVFQAEHILQSEWPAGADLTGILKACSPSNIRAIADHVAKLEAERDAAFARIKKLEDACVIMALEMNGLGDLNDPHAAETVRKSFTKDQSNG